MPFDKPRRTSVGSTIIYGEEIARQRVPEQVDAVKAAWARYGTDVLL
jgi:exo-beta-1,3-glucanase (GH17 family)